MQMNDDFVRLSLKQARRREIPYNLFKLLLATLAILFLLSAVQNCGTPPPEKPLTNEQKKQNTAALWADESKAHKTRLP